MLSNNFQMVWEPLCNFFKDGGLYCNFGKIWGQNVILGNFGSKRNFVELGSKYGYWKVPDQKAIFEEN